jgi:hypothetical protein
MGLIFKRIYRTAQSEADPTYIMSTTGCRFWLHSFLYKQGTGFENCPVNPVTYI